MELSTGMEWWNGIVEWPHLRHFLMDGGKGSFLRAQFVSEYLLGFSLDNKANEGPLGIQERRCHALTSKQAPEVIEDQEQELLQEGFI